MPLFHIELRTSTRVWEAETVEKDDHTALRVEVARFAGELLQSHATEIWIDQDWRIDVTDANGLILYYLEVSASETAATMSRPKL